VCDELPVGVHKVQSHAVDDSRVHDERQSVCDDYAKLQYVDVKITDCDKLGMKVLSALNDSGAQISVIRSDVLGNLHVPYFGKVKLRGIVGSPVSADLVKLDVALSNNENDKYITVLCAVCFEANDDLVLASDVVDSLFGKQIKANVANITHDDDDDDNAECDDDDVSDVIDDHSTTVKNADNSRPNVTDITVNESAADCDSDSVNDCTSVMGNKPLSQSESNAETLRQEQLEDDTLKGWWFLAKRGKGGFIEKDGLLYHIKKILGQTFSQLCLPKSRRGQVLELAHDTFGGHLGEKRIRERIRLSFTWPSLTSDCKRYCQTCTVCQKRARTTYRDRVPITPIPRAEAPFTHWFVDCLGPILNQKIKYNYCLVLCDSAIRWPAAYPLRSLSAKHVCKAMLQLWIITGIPSTVSSDNATNFSSKLNREFFKRLGCSPRFNTPGTLKILVLLRGWWAHSRI